MTVCGQGRRGLAIAVSTKFSGMPLTRGDHHHAVQPPTSEGVPIGHAEIEKAGVQLSQVNEESSVTNVRIAVFATLVGSDARHGTTTLWPSR